MKRWSIVFISAAALALLLGVIATSASAAVTIYDYRVPGVKFAWQVVVNNGVNPPGDTRTFNSYNQPSMNVDGLVVFRARTKGGMMGGGGEPTHGVFVRDMDAETPVATIFDRKTAVPQPNNIQYPPFYSFARFIEPPSFPRIDMWSNTVASRGNHQPVWQYFLPDSTETRTGTTGIYTTPFGSLVTGMSNAGAVPDFSFFSVPGTQPAVKFDVFPGTPAVTRGSTIVFKGNFTEDGTAKTGVYYRDLADAPINLGDGTELLGPAGGMGLAVRIADTDTLIPGTDVRFGSTAPPSAVDGMAVFAGFDNEANPTKGGIYRAPLMETDPTLTTLVKIGGQVPGERSGVRFRRLGEGVSYDGRFVAFWGSWGTATRTLVLQCPTEGNKDRIAYCKLLYPNGYTTTVPKYQGIFVHDTKTTLTYAVAKTPTDFMDFVYWNFSGKVPGSSEGDDGEPARWRSTAFVAVSGLVDGSLDDANFHVSFKARQGELIGGAYLEPVDGVYLRKGPSGRTKIAALVQTGMAGTSIDPAAVDPLTGTVQLVTEMGVERDGFRGDAIVLNVRMGTEEAGWAGIYLTTVPAALR